MTLFERQKRMVDRVDGTIRGRDVATSQQLFLELRRQRSETTVQRENQTTCTFEKKLDRVLSRFHSSLYMLADVQEVSNIGVQQPFAPVARCTLPHSQGKNPQRQLKRRVVIDKQSTPRKIYRQTIVDTSCVRQTRAHYEGVYFHVSVTYVR